MSNKYKTTVSLAEHSPDIAAEFVAELNGCQATEISHGSNFVATWKCCVCGRVYQKPVKKRTSRGDGCLCASPSWTLDSVQELIKHLAAKDNLTMESFLPFGVMHTNCVGRYLIESLLSGETSFEKALQLSSSELEEKYPSKKRRANRTKKGGSYSWRLRFTVHSRDDFSCCVCGKECDEDITLDRFWPKALGGLAEEDNLWTLCSTCNSRKGSSFPTSDHEKAWKDRLGNLPPKPPGVIFFQERRVV